MARANVLGPLRWKRAKIHRGSRRRNIGPHHEAGYTSAVVTEPESVKVVAIGRGPYTSTYEALGVKRIVSERQWQISSICLSGIQGSEPDCMTRLVFEHDQPHIRSPFATAAPTSRLRRAGLRKTRTILENGVSGHGLLRFVDLDPSGLILSWGLRDWLGAHRHAVFVFITAPSMTTPAVTYFQSATSSFRAAPISLRRRPPLRFTRSWNQRASAESG